MKGKLRTHCPACHTTFSLTRAQLDAREGLVRCGRCSAVFRADRYLLDPLAEQDQEQKTPPAVGTKRAGARKRPQRATLEQVGPAPEARGERTPLPEEFVTEDLAEVLTGKRRRRIPGAHWGLGALLLLVALLAQIVFFYSDEIARYPQLKPSVLAACEWLGCEVRAQQNVELIELLRSSVAAHPERANSLRIRASLVNRAEFAQPHPVMEITLTDTAGAVVARRTFAPRQYLKDRSAAKNDMIPHLVVEALLDVASPDPSPGGYEIRLLPH